MELNKLIGASIIERRLDPADQQMPGNGIDQGDRGQ
jgi:hypothetical protein